MLNGNDFDNSQIPIRDLQPDLQRFQGNWDEVVDDFDAMKLREMLLRGIYAYG